MKMRTQTMSAVIACVVVSFGVTVMAGCGDDQTSAAAPYGVGKTVVNGAGHTGVYDTPQGDGCIDIGSQCVSPQDQCGEAAKVDVIVDADGEHVETVCYPPDDVTHDDHKGSVKTDADGASVVLDDRDDGADVTDNVEFKGNNSTLYGHGPDVSVIRGNVKITGNNAALRGVLIEGNVDMEGNDGHLTNCVIHGNLHIKGNGNTVVDCVVFGDINASYDDASDTTLIGNYAQKDFRAEHETSVCSGNYTFDDANENLQLEASEKDDAQELSCPTE